MLSTLSRYSYLDLFNNIISKFNENKEGLTNPETGDTLTPEQSWFITGVVGFWLGLVFLSLVVIVLDSIGVYNAFRCSAQTNSWWGIALLILLLIPTGIGNFVGTIFAIMFVFQGGRKLLDPKCTI
tara:strand:- start:363 stop:740 length:378 start_codon:yes stop_codon:yes gene_type:complete